MLRRILGRSAAYALPIALACSLLPHGFAQDAPESNSEDEATAKADEPEPLPERPPVATQGKLPLEWVDAHRWRSIGPANMGGRMTDIAVNPNDHSEYWIATATGGVVHTTNNGVSYEHQFTNQRVSSVGAIAVAPSDPTHVWAGTGENNPRNSVSWGDGVYVSHDSGATWRHAGLEETFQISTIVVHPDDPNVVYVGAVGRLWGPNDERGLYKTTDGGRSWERLHFVDEDTGVIDVKMHPEDPDTIVIATYQRRRDMFDTNDPAVKWGDGSAIWRTKDGGETWAKLTEGLPSTQLGRIGLCWSGSEPDNLFAVVETNQITQEPENAAWFGVSFESADIGARVRSIVEDSPAEGAGLKEGDIILRIADTPILDQTRLRRALRDYFAGDVAKIEAVRDGEVVELEITFDKQPEEEEERLDVHGRRRDGPFGIGLGGQRSNAQDQQGPDGHQYGGIFKSEDKGSTWTRINSLNPRPMYYSEIRVDPSDENYIYVLGTRLHKSSDGGKTFSSNGHGGDVHVDHHAMWVDPSDGRHILLGNDGGLYVTYDRMENWNHHNRMALGQFYNVTAGPRTFYMVYGGLQDNGSWGGPSRTSDTGATNEDWFRVGGGDGFRCIVDPNNPDLVYYESQNGGMGRRDFASGEGGFLRPRSPRGGDVTFRFNWNTPFLLSNFNSEIYYSAGNYVFKSVQKGTSQRRISPEISATDRGAAVALAESPLDQDVLYVGTDDGALWMTEDGGTEWVDLMALNGAPAFEAAVAAEKKEDKKKATTEARAKRVSNVVGSLETPQEEPGLAGTWSCKAVGEGIEDDSEGRFTLMIEVDDLGKVSGSLESEIGTGALKRIRWSESSGSLTFRFEGDALTLQFDAKVDVENGTMSGTIEAAGGAFSFDWTGDRGEAAESAEEESSEEAASEEATSEEAKSEEVADEADSDDTKSEEKPKAKKKKKKQIKDTIDQLLPGRRYVSDLKASKFSRKRVYATFDGHRSDDGMPHVFVSEDLGRSWTSLRSNLPDSAGSVRAILEDATSEDVLYIGCEFGVYVSIDRGESWTRLNSNLPTVPVHDLAQHTGMRELVAGTHGRSVWILDIGFIGQMNEDVMEADATLFDPTDVHLQSRGRSHGRTGNHVFTAENPYSGAVLGYVLNKRSRDIALEVLDVEGKVVASLDADGAKGFHRVQWNLRRSSAGASSGQRGRRSRARRVAPGTYCVRLTVDGVAQMKTFEVHNDPAQPTTEWIGFEDAEEDLQRQFDEQAAAADKD
ncbi:MAG: PDZ domain-containing protein [Planctomycetota bacterium]